MDHGHGEHNGIHHGKMNAELTHELNVHFMGQTHDGHAGHHSEQLLKHLEEDDGHGPAMDRPTTTTQKPSRASRTLTAYCDMRQNRALPKNTRHNIAGKVVFTQPANGGPLTIRVNLKGLRSTGGGSSLHGFHVHETAPDEEGNCNQAGAHYNPGGQQSHGGPSSSSRHVGDFGNVENVDSAGINAVLTDTVASLSGPNSILNRTLIVSLLKRSIESMELINLVWGVKASREAGRLDPQSGFWTPPGLLCHPRWIVDNCIGSVIE